MASVVFSMWRIIILEIQFTTQMVLVYISEGSLIEIYFKNYLGIEIITHALVLSFGVQVSHEFDDRMGSKKSFKPDWNPERNPISKYLLNCVFYNNFRTFRKI